MSAVEGSTSTPKSPGGKSGRRSGGKGRGAASAEGGAAVATGGGGSAEAVVSPSGVVPGTDGPRAPASGSRGVKGNKGKVAGGVKCANCGKANHTAEVCRGPGGGASKTRDNTDDGGSVAGSVDGSVVSSFAGSVASVGGSKTPSSRARNGGKGQKDRPTRGSPGNAAAGLTADATATAPVAAENPLTDLCAVVAALVPGTGASSSGCPWCASSSAPQLLGHLRSELAEAATEMDAAQGLAEKQASAAAVGGAAGGANEDLASLEQQRAAVGGRLEDEVGDMLFDLVLLARLCERDDLGASLAGAAAAASTKVRRRCPYLFDPGAVAADSALAAEVAWQAAKEAEKAAAAAEAAGPGAEASADAAVAVAVAAAEVGAARAGDAVVLFAKWPSVGTSKTRLTGAAGLGGAEGAAAVASAMLADSIFSCLGGGGCLGAATKAVVFAPRSTEASFRALLVEVLGPVEGGAVHLVPMADGVSGSCDAEAALTATDLGGKLKAAVAAVRKLPRPTGAVNAGTAPRLTCTGAVCVVGMDSPELSPLAVGGALAASRKHASAVIVPALDGGYALIALPPASPAAVRLLVLCTCRVCAVLTLKKRRDKKERGIWWPVLAFGREKKEQCTCSSIPVAWRPRRHLGERVALRFVVTGL